MSPANYIFLTQCLGGLFPNIVLIVKLKQMLWLKNMIGLGLPDGVCAGGKKNWGSQSFNN